MRKKLASFQTLILHELAHIVNRDIPRTYFAGALWVALIVMMVIPLILGAMVYLVSSYTLRNPGESLNVERLLIVSLPALLVLCLQMGAMLLIVRAIFASLLRVREVYADWRAVLWEAKTGLTAILQDKIPKAETHPFQEAKRPSWRLHAFNALTLAIKSVSFQKTKRPVWLLHPSPADRLTFIEKPIQLFSLTWDLPAIVGVLLALIVTSSVNLVLPLALSIGTAASILVDDIITIAKTAVGGSQELLLIYIAQIGVLLSFLLTIVLVIFPIGGIAYLIAGTIGVQIQRRAVADGVERRQSWLAYKALWGPALLVMAGFQLGFLMTPHPMLLPTSVSAIMWLLSVAVLTWLCLVYAYSLSRRILCSHVGAKPPIWKQRILTFVVGVVIWLAYIPLVVSLLTMGYNTNASAQALGWEASAIAIALFFLLYLIIFAISWVFVWIGQVFFPGRCPSCQYAVRQVTVIGKQCPQCGHALEPWLFIPEANGDVSTAILDEKEVNQHPE